MKFGIALPYNIARVAPRLAEMAEEADWDGFYLGDAIWHQDPMVTLAAAAMTTNRIRLGTMLIPAPLRRPWKIASEAAALDQLSNGRLTLGLGMGAVWMGWQGFPDAETDTRVRAQMLDETIDILTLLDRRKQFDFDGEHYQVKLTQLDEMYFPPKPVQQPRVPIWIPALFDRRQSMRRILKCDGVFPEKRNASSEPAAVAPEDLAAIKAYVDEHRTLQTPFDIVVSGKTGDMDRTEQQEKMIQWRDAGATWWIEDMFDGDETAATARIRQGPPVSSC